MLKWRASQVPAASLVWPPPAGLADPGRLAKRPQRGSLSHAPLRSPGPGPVDERGANPSLPRLNSRALRFGSMSAWLRNAASDSSSTASGLRSGRRRINSSAKARRHELLANSPRPINHPHQPAVCAENTRQQSGLALRPLNICSHCGQVRLQARTLRNRGSRIDSRKALPARP